MADLPRFLAVGLADRVPSDRPTDGMAMSEFVGGETGESRTMRPLLALQRSVTEFPNIDVGEEDFEGDA